MREPGDASEDVVPRDVTELVREHEPHLAERERPAEQRVPDHDVCRRPEPDGEGVVMNL